MLNVSETAKDTAIVVIEGESETVPRLEWYNFQWPLVALNQDFKITIFWTSSNLTQKRYKIKPYLLLTLQGQTGIKSYIMFYPSAPFSLTLNDPLTQISKSRQYSVDASASNGTI